MLHGRKSVEAHLVTAWLTGITSEVTLQLDNILYLVENFANDPHARSTVSDLPKLFLPHLLV